MASTTDLKPSQAKTGPVAARPSNGDDDGSSSPHGSADNVLVSLGYTPELSRNRSTLQVAFMSFVLASIPYGLATTMAYPLVAGGPANIVWGWVLVSLVVVCVAASLGEVTSVYPTAGGIYYQAYMLAPPRSRRLASWVCGWLYLTGNVTITLAVNFGTACFLAACVNVFEVDEQPVLASGGWQVFLIFLAITLLCNAVSALGNKWLPLLDTFAVFWTFIGLVALLACVLAIAREGRRSAGFVFGHFEVNSGWMPGWSFMVGLLQAAYATSATGMVISMCEEVRQPATQVPRAMVLTACLNAAAGLLFLLPLMFALPEDLSVLLALSQPVPVIVRLAVGSAAGTFALLVPLLVLAVICGIGCTTATSRCAWAFARDGAVPGARWWRRIDPALGVPLNAMMLTMAVEILLGLIYFGSAAAFNAFSGVGVIALTAAYAIPILVSMMEGRRTVSAGSFNLGPVVGWFCNIVSVTWTLLAVPLFCMPSVIPVTASTMNYASVVFASFVAISFTWYMVWGKKHYTGPPT